VLSVTADSNIWVSAFNYPGKPRRLIEMADASEVRIDISDHIIEEVLRTLRLKFEWAPERLQEAEAQMDATARKVTPTQAVDIVKDDPTDNRILECALEAGSGYVVTGDKDMLRVGKFGSIPIIRVADFLEILSGQQKGPDV
jgi:putative PIN family toxin of toxin-antitoxin system